MLLLFVTRRWSILYQLQRRQPGGYNKDRQSDLADYISRKIEKIHYELPQIHHHLSTPVYWCYFPIFSWRTYTWA